MKLKNVFGLLMITLMLSSCYSSVDILNTWKSDDMGVLKEKNFLVIARTHDRGIRLTYENEVMDRLTKRGIKGSPSYKVLPMVDPDKKISEDEVKALKKSIQDQGFNAVVLTVVKDVEEYTKTDVDYNTQYYSGISYYPTYYRGFYGYYRYPGAYTSINYSYDYPTEVTVKTAKDYIVETVIYNLDKADKEQLVAIVTARIKEPKEIQEITEKYLDKVGQQFK